MHVQLQQSSLLIGRKPNGFIEHYYTEWDDGLGKEKISLFLVMSLGSTQVPGADIGKEAFQLLQDHFLDDLSGDPYDRFENALREVNLMVMEREKDLGVIFIPNMHVIGGVIQEDMLFLSQRGDAQGYLVRKRHVSSITDGLYDEMNREDLFQNIASGVLEVGDSLVLVTGPLVQYVTPNDLSKIFSEQSLDEASKELEDLLHSDIEDQMALLSFEVLEKGEEILADGSDEEEIVLEKMEAKEEAPIKTLRDAKWKKSMHVLRSWLSHKERWAFLTRFKTMEKKKLAQLIIVLIVITAVGLVGLRFATGKQRLLDKLETSLSVAKDNISQAETRGAFDKEEASLLLNEAEDIAVEVLNSGYFGGQASQILDDVEVQRDYLDNVVHIDDELVLKVNFSEYLGTAAIEGVEPYDDRVVVYTQSDAFQVLIDEVQSPDQIDSVEKVIAADYFADRGNIVMLTSSGSVLEYTDGNTQFADTSDAEWHGGIDITSYSSKIYLLDEDNNQIWKYQRGTGAYGSGSAYLDAETEVDLSGAISLAIDGNIWVLKDDGTLIKLLSGDEVVYDVRKAPLTSVDTASMVYTELEINQLYLLDPVNNRILIYNKSSQTDDITYSSQYVFDDLMGELKDMYVDKDRDVIVIVTDLALYELSF